MSSTLAPSNEQSPTNVTNVVGIDNKRKPLSFAKTAKKEYIAGGGFGSADVNITLAHRSDALTKKFGDEIVKKMMRDPEIAKCIRVLKISVLADGVIFFPAVSKPAKFVKRPNNTDDATKKLEYDNDLKRYEQAQRYADFATRAIENLDTTFRSTLYNMLDAIIYGNKVAEQTYVEIPSKIVNRDWKKMLEAQEASIFEESTLWTLKSIRVKPRNAVHFEIDKFSTLVGFSSPFAQNNAENKILPREKFLVLTFQGQDEDPRGNTILEAVYNAWHLKMQLWPEYLRWLLQCAIPGLVGYTSDTTDNKRYLRDENNDLIKDADGNPLYEADVETLLNALQQMRNSTAIALPHGAKVEPINNAISGDPFKGMRDVLNEEIEMGLILQTLATSEGRNMSRAAAQSHMSILDLFVWFIKGLVMDMITNDLLKPLFKANFGEDFDMNMLPIVSMGDTERRDFALDVTAISLGVKSGFFGKSQFIGLDKMVGAPDRDVEADDEDAKIKSENEIALKNAGKAQAVDSGTSSNPKLKPKQATRQAMDRMLELMAQYEELENED